MKFSNIQLWIHAVFVAILSMCQVVNYLDNIRISVTIYRKTQKIIIIIIIIIVNFSITFFIFMYMGITFYSVTLCNFFKK